MTCVIIDFEHCRQMKEEKDRRRCAQRRQEENNGRVLRQYGIKPNKNSVDVKDTDLDERMSRISSSIKRIGALVDGIKQEGGK